MRRALKGREQRRGEQREKRVGHLLAVFSDPDRGQRGGIVAALRFREVSVQDWWGVVVLVASIATGAVVAWNSKASAADLDGIKQLLAEQDRKAAALDGKLMSIERLYGEMVQLRTRVDRIGELAIAARQPPPSATAASGLPVAAAQQSSPP